MSSGIEWCDEVGNLLGCGFLEEDPLKHDNGAALSAIREGAVAGVS